MFQPFYLQSNLCCRDSLEFLVGDIEKFLEKVMQLFIACKLDKYGNWGKSRALNVE